MPRSVISNALEEVPPRLQQITMANGYNTDAGTRVEPLNSKTRPRFSPETGETDIFPLIRWSLDTVQPDGEELGTYVNSVTVPARINFSVYGHDIGDVLPLMDDIIYAMNLWPLIDGVGGIVPTLIAITTDADSAIDSVRIDYIFNADSQKFGHDEVI